jgi:hypothetical protein
VEGTPQQPTTCCCGVADRPPPQDSRSEALEKFAAKDPPLESYETELERYDRIVSTIEAMPQNRAIGAPAWNAV